MVEINSHLIKTQETEDSATTSFNRLAHFVGWLVVTNSLVGGFFLLFDRESSSDRGYKWLAATSIFAGVIYFIGRTRYVFSTKSKPGTEKYIDPV